MDCDLCDAARFTHWYFEDEICWVADCEACLVPMVVWKQHRTDPDETEQAHMFARLEEAALARFATMENVDLAVDMRTIPDHWHAHARDANWHRDLHRRRLSRYTGVGSERTER